MTPAFDALMSFQRETEALSQVMGRLGWDQETMMPRGAADQRADEMAALQRVVHGRRGDARIGEWLEQIDAEALDAAGQANLRLIRRRFDRARRVPDTLAAEIARTTSRGHRIWAEARANEDVASFLPVLSEIVGLRREEGAALSDEGDVYDALLENYEPETSGAEIAAIFDAMRPRLVALRAAILDKPMPDAISGHFDETAQMKLSRELAKVFGYDMTRGRVDKAIHPFSSGSGNDVRITTRTDPADPFNCIYSTIHEVGHAAYELSIDQAHLLTPVGRGASMGVHESQSRIYENQLGRSRTFTGWLFGRMTDSFGDIGVKDADAFFAAVNRVKNGYIRTEADEVQYNLHIMLRFDLERALIGRELEVADLEDAWNTRFEADFGYPVDKPSHGVLQDVHWSEGLFGYFPTYALGNVYAGCLHEALRRDVPDLDAQLAEGDLGPATEWLREALQQHGGMRSPRGTIEHATGAAISEKPLLDYLEAKFGGIYGL